MAISAGKPIRNDRAANTAGEWRMSPPDSAVPNVTATAVHIDIQQSFTGVPFSLSEPGAASWQCPVSAIWA